MQRTVVPRPNHSCTSNRGSSAAPFCGQAAGWIYPVLAGLVMFEDASLMHGYDLMLACTKCRLKKRIREFPSAAGLILGDILASEHIGIFEKGCLRCGTCRFEVLSAPAPAVLSKGPTGWVKKKVAP